MNIVMPMAGLGSRFSNQGFNTPKPFIEVLDRPLFAWALESIKNVSSPLVVFIALRQHLEKKEYTDLFKKHCPYPFTIIPINKPTRGQSETVLCARGTISEEEALLIIPSDSFSHSQIHHDLNQLDSECGGLIQLIEQPGERWSFAKLNSKNEIIEVAEKNRISPWVSTGVYHFSRASLFFEAAQARISSEKTTKGEYYIMPLYQDLMNQGIQLKASFANSFWDLGTPESLRNFIHNFMAKPS